MLAGLYLNLRKRILPIEAAGKRHYIPPKTPNELTEEELEEITLCLLIADCD